MSQTAQVNLFGTPSSPTTLTNSFVAGDAVLALDFKKLSFDVTYTPAESSAYAQIVLEYCNQKLEDANGSTGASALTQWRAFATAIPGTTQVDVYAQGGDQMGTASGTPINIPTSGTSVAAQVVNVHISPDTDLNSVWIRIRAKEKFTSTAGTLYVGGQLLG